MPLYGLIGHPVAHSLSKEFFTKFFLENNLADHQYELFDLPEPALFPQLIATRNPAGLNVTIPYKETILSYLDVLDENARAIGAVNCIKFVDGKLHGYNTDYSAFRQTLENLHLPNDVSALVFGSGGSSHAVAAALRSLGISYQIVSRTADDSQLDYGQLNHKVLREHRLLINCTPVGMRPKTEERLVLPYEYISEKHIAYDLIYNPAETLFLKECRLRGATTLNGLSMLELQALHSWAIWNRPE